MAGLERIDVTRIEVNQYCFYRVVTTEDEESGRNLLDSHLFMPGELLELAAYAEENRAQLDLEAQENDARDKRGQSEGIKDMAQIKGAWQQYHIEGGIESE